MPRVRLYRDGALISEDIRVEDISEHIKQPDSVVWLDLCAPDEVEIKVAAAEFGLHELAVEDAVHPLQRPKVDVYGGYACLSTYAVRLDAVTGELATSEIGAFVMKRALITVRKDDGFDMDAVVARWDDAGVLSRHGVGFLLYGLLDHVVDGHFEAVQRLDESMEALEDMLFDDRPYGSELQKRSFALRKSLVHLRRVALPMREVLNTVMRRQGDIVDDALAPYFQDVYDHVLRVFEWTESLRDLVTTILETHLTMQGNRMNLIMKKVTSWAAIIAVPTAVTGFYGQNLPYPGFASESGLLMSTGSIVVLSVGLYVLFRARDWI